MDTQTMAVVAALRAEADRHTRAASKLSLDVMRERDEQKRDIRSSAVKVVEVMGTGQQLNEVASGLESGTLLLVSAAAELLAGKPDGADDEPPTPPDDDPDGGDDDERGITSAQVVNLFKELEREEAADAGS